MGMGNYIDRIIEADVKNGEISGADICVIKNNEEIYRKQYGYSDKERHIAMPDDAIFRMYSMTKPVTAVAMMILVERGIIDLNDPVSKYMDTYKNPKVLSNGKIINAKREILIKDIMNMTSGMSYPDSNTLAGRIVGDLYDVLQKEQREGKGRTTVEWCRELGKLPLEFNPGEEWRYGTSADVCGAVIEIVSGKRLSEFMREEIFEPLRMKYTDFYVPEEKWDRFTQVYEYTEDGILSPYECRHLGITDYRTLPAFESAGAGLVSTINDYKRFALMLLNDGEYNGRTILHRKTMDYLRTPCVGDELLANREWESQRGYTYGNLMRIMKDIAQAGTLGSVGEFGWDGWTGNYFLVDPAENMIMLYFIQRINGGKFTTINKLRNVIYGNLGEYIKRFE